MKLEYDIEYLDSKKLVVITTAKKISSARGTYRYIIQLPKFWIKKFKEDQKFRVEIRVIEGDG